MRKADFMTLGNGSQCRYSTDSQVTGLNNNVIVIGTSGCGKTVSIVEPRLMDANERSLIVTLTKRRPVYQYSPYMESKGYRVLDLNFVNPSEGNVGFDLLSGVKTDKDITFLATSIVMANPKKKEAKTDPYWDEGAISLVSAEIAYVRNHHSNPTMAAVLDLHSKLAILNESGGVIQTSLDKLFEQAKGNVEDRFAVSCWMSFKQLPARTASCIYSALNTTIDTIFTAEFIELFNMSRKVDFRELARQKTVLFVTSSPVNPSANALISMFYASAFKELFEFAQTRPNGRLPIDVDVIADDFATGCPVNDFDQYISIFREAGISSTILVQSESQLTSLYGVDAATTIINNCDTIVYLGSMDLKTCQNISYRANKPLEDILYMPLGHEILFRRGQKPIFTERYQTLKNPVYKKIMKDYQRRYLLEERAGEEADRRAS